MERSFQRYYRTLLLDGYKGKSSTRVVTYGKSNRYWHPPSLSLLLPCNNGTFDAIRIIRSWTLYQVNLKIYSKYYGCQSYYGTMSCNTYLRDGLVSRWFYWWWTNAVIDRGRRCVIMARICCVYWKQRLGTRQSNHHIIDRDEFRTHFHLSIVYIYVVLQLCLDIV